MRTLIAMFVVLEGCAIAAYPGGHELDRAYAGFHPLYNYWCDLFGFTAYGRDNGLGAGLALAGLVPMLAAAGLFANRVARAFPGALGQAARASGWTALALSPGIPLTAGSGLAHTAAIAAAGAPAVASMALTMAALLRARAWLATALGAVLAVCWALMSLEYARYVLFGPTGFGSLAIAQRLALVAFFAWLLAAHWRLR